uniref:Uncharacterized protein n=1 Tax=Solanum lycopersicum TaxID=4081 RepID=A0A3Q7F2W0_SOLLC
MGTDFTLLTQILDERFLSKIISNARSDTQKTKNWKKKHIKNKFLKSIINIFIEHSKNSAMSKKNEIIAISSHLSNHSPKSHTGHIFTAGNSNLVVLPSVAAGDSNLVVIFIVPGGRMVVHTGSLRTMRIESSHHSHSGIQQLHILTHLLLQSLEMILLKRFGRRRKRV